MIITFSLCIKHILYQLMIELILTSVSEQTIMFDFLILRLFANFCLHGLYSSLGFMVFTPIYMNPKLCKLSFLLNAYLDKLLRIGIHELIIYLNNNYILKVATFL